MSLKPSNPYGKKNHSGEYSFYFNLFHYYFDKFSVGPSVYEVSTPVKGSTFKKLEKNGFKRVFLCELEKFKEGKKIINNMEVCYEFEDVFVLFFRKESIVSRIEYLREFNEDQDIEWPEEDDNIAAYRCKILYQNQENLNKINKLIDRNPDAKEKGNVYLLCSIDGLLSLQRFDIKLPEEKINLDLNYGQEAAEKFEKITACLKKNKNGLILFSGDPGTGKSTFIKYLTTKTKRKIIYLSSAAVEQLTNPDFLSFIMGYRNCILLLEDAEKVLKSRDTQDNEAISNILNITDGILGDCLNIMVIATFNIERDKIDSALVRKGRLLFEHHFTALSVENSNQLLKKIGSKRETQVPLTLAEIYNEENNYHEKKEEKRRVGF